MHISLTKKESFIVLIVILLLCLPRLVAIYLIEITLFEDMQYYMYMAQKFVREGLLQEQNGSFAFHSPGYPLVLSGAFFLFDDTVATAQYLNLVISAASFVVLFFSARIFLPFKWSLLPVVIWGIYPPAIMYVLYPAKEILMIFLMLVQFYLILKIFKQKNTYLICISGFIYALQILVGAAMVFIIFIIFYVLWRTYNRFLDKIYVALFFIISVMIALSPYLMYTKHHLGKAIISSSTGQNLFVGNYKGATGDYPSNDFIDTQENHKNTVLGDTSNEINDNEYWLKLATAYIKTHPVDTVILSFKKLLFFWALPLHEGKYGNQSLLETMMRYCWLFSDVIILLFALLGFAYRKNLSKDDFIIITGYIFTFTLSFAIFFLKYRFRLPIMPIVILLSSNSLYCLLQQLNAKYNR